MKYVKLFEEFSKDLNEGRVTDLNSDDIKGIASSSSFMNIGKELRKKNVSFDFITSPMPVYMIKMKDGKTFALVNKKYADDAEWVEGDIAGGVMENLEELTEFINENSGYKFKVETVDGEKRVAVYKDGKFIEDVDVHSQFSVKDAKEFLKNKYMESLNESAGTVDTTISVPSKVSYDITSSLVDDIGNLSDYVLDMVNDLRLISGNISFDDTSISIKGKTIHGDSLIASQVGEYHMYGGPYTPKMKKPSITLNGKNLMPLVNKAYKNHGWVPEKGNHIDISRTDIWGSAVRK